MRLLVCGGRDFEPRWYVEEVLDEITEVLDISLVINGGAPGVDRWAWEWAKSRRIPTETFTAKWAEWGRIAGIIRNRDMLKNSKPELVVAFPGPKSKGTWHMVDISRKAGVPVLVMPADRSAIPAMGNGAFV